MSGGETELQAEIAKLTKINNALIARVERSMEQQGNSYSLFTTAIGLESQIRARTDELKTALESLERSNEALVVARDTAEQAMQVRTRFFTAVGHDVLQPLHAARLSLSALGESDEIEEHKKLARQIDHALTSIEELLRTILDISKLETGVIQPSPKDVMLAEIFDRLEVDFAPMIAEKGLDFDVALPASLGVYTDPAMMRRVLQNLLSNAVRYTDTGTITLAAKRVGPDVEISIGDTGPGIDAEEQKRIFEEFQRGGAGQGVGQGVSFGLGLSIVQRMINALGHRIALTSCKGDGTTFTLTLPYSSDAVAAAPDTPSTTPRATQQYDFENVRVVIVENDPNVLQAMQQVLNQWSCDAEPAESLDDIEAMIAADMPRPDIVLADFHLNANKTGLNAMAALRKVYGQELPGIVITADRGPQTAEAVADANCELLHKPVRPGELRALIRHMLTAG